MIIDDDGTMHGTPEEFAALMQEDIDELRAQADACKTTPCVSPRHRSPSCDVFDIFERAMRNDDHGFSPADLIVELITNLLILGYDLGEEATALLDKAHGFYLGELENALEDPIHWPGEKHTSEHASEGRPALGFDGKWIGDHPGLIDWEKSSTARTLMAYEQAADEEAKS